MAAGRLRRAATSPSFRWGGALVIALGLTLTLSVNLALRVADVSLDAVEDGRVAYRALGSMTEVGFDPAGAPDAPGTEGTTRVRSGPRFRTAPSPTPSPDPEPEPDDDDDDGQLHDGDRMVVTAAADRSTAAQGEPILYTFSIRNISEESLSNVIFEMHVPSGTYASGSCDDLTEEGTLRPPVCTDVPGLPSAGSDEWHVFKVFASLEPGEYQVWNLRVRVGSDAPDGVTIVNHGRARSGSLVQASDDVWVDVV